MTDLYGRIGQQASSGSMPSIVGQGQQALSQWYTPQTAWNPMQGDELENYYQQNMYEPAREQLTKTALTDINNYYNQPGRNPFSSEMNKAYTTTMADFEKDMSRQRTQLMYNETMAGRQESVRAQEAAQQAAMSGLPIQYGGYMTGDLPNSQLTQMGSYVDARNQQLQQYYNEWMRQQYMYSPLMQAGQAVATGGPTVSSGTSSSQGGGGSPWASLAGTALGAGLSFLPMGAAAQPAMSSPWATLRGFGGSQQG